jgi:hypothetical protein
MIFRSAKKKLSTACRASWDKDFVLWQLQTLMSWGFWVCVKKITILAVYCANN